MNFPLNLLKQCGNVHIKCHIGIVTRVYGLYITLELCSVSTSIVLMLMVSFVFFAVNNFNTIFFFDISRFKITIVSFREKIAFTGNKYNCL